MTSDPLRGISSTWAARLKRVRRSQARRVTDSMTRPSRDAAERAFLAARGQLGRFVELATQVTTK